MATNFPSSLDTNTELGGPFLNKYPVTDPIKQIDANLRNNLNDAVFALESKIGITNSTDTSSLTWALLCVGGTYNQGIRFASTNTQWPGNTAENGIFWDSTSNAPAFHVAGDPATTFTVIGSGGGSSTWNDIYAAVAGSYLDISTGDKPLYLRQQGSTDLNGPLLRLERTYKTATTAYDDAVLLLHSTYSLTGTDGAPTLYVKHDAENTTIENFAAVIDIGDFPYTSGIVIKRSAGTTNTNRYLIKTEDVGIARFIARQNGSVKINTSTDTLGEWALEIAANDSSGTGGVLVDFATTAGGFILDLQENAVDRFTVLANGNVDIFPEDDEYGLYINCVVTNGSTSLDGLVIDMSRSVSVNIDGRNVFGATSYVYSNASDATTTETFHAAYHAELVGTLPATYSNINYVGFHADSTLMAGLWSNAPSVVETDPSGSLVPGAMLVFNSASSGTSTSFEVLDGTIASSTARFTINRTGEISGNSAVDVANSPAVRFKNTWSTYNTGMVLELVSNDGSTATEVMRVYHTGKTTLKSHSTTSAVPVLELNQQDTDQSFILYTGTEGADQTSSISTVQGDSTTVVGPLAKATTNGWNFSKMIKVSINGSDYYLCAYVPAP